MRLTIAITVFTALLVACSSDNSTATPTHSEPAIGPGPPQTVINCAGCPLVDVTRVIDGDTIDTIKVIPINWAAADPNDAASVFSPDFIGKPKHAEPSATITINGNATNNTLSESWVIDENGTVYILVRESVY